MPLILIISLSFILGIVISPLFTKIFHLLILALMIGSSAFVSWLFRTQRPVLFVGVGLSCFLLGIARYQQRLPGEGPLWIHFYNGCQVDLEGLVVNSPEKRGRVSKVIVDPRTVGIRGQSLVPECKGRILLTLRVGKGIKYGDKLRLRGELIHPPVLEEFSYKDYLAQKGIHSLMEFPTEVEVLGRGEGNLLFEKVFALRKKLLVRLERFFPEPEASLLAGIVLGVKRHFAESFYEEMRITGVLHIIVASGFNISLLMDKTAAFMADRQRWQQSIILIILVGAYTVMAGLEPPIIRAAIMGGIGYLATVTSRCQHGVLTLLVAAAGMLFFRPLLYKSLSFQLSFGATLALMLIFPHFMGKFNFLPYGVGEALGSTLSVQVMLVPWLMYKFSSVSLIAPLVNALVLPLIGGVMWWGLLWLAVSYLLPSALVEFLSWFLWLPVEFFVFLVRCFGNFSWAGVEEVKTGLWVVVGYYLVLLVVLWRIEWAKGSDS